jgi:hypothetical protein
MAPHDEAYSALAHKYGSPKAFVAAAREVLEHAFSLARSVITLDYMDGFDWAKYQSVGHIAVNTEIDVPWSENINRLIKATKGSHVDFRRLKYQQRYIAANEIDRRCAPNKGLTRAQAEKEVYKELVACMDRGSSSGRGVKEKSKKELHQLHALNPDHSAMICSRPNQDEWRGILRNEANSKTMTAQQITTWVDLLGPACHTIWYTQVLLTTKSPGWNALLRDFYVSQNRQFNLSLQRHRCSRVPPHVSRRRNCSRHSIPGPHVCCHFRQRYLGILGFCWRPRAPPNLGSDSHRHNRHTNPRDLGGPGSRRLHRVCQWPFTYQPRQCQASLLERPTQPGVAALTWATLYAVRRPSSYGR